MKSADLKRLIPRVFLDTPFRLSLLYVSLFSTVVALTFSYVYVTLQGVMIDSVQTALRSDLEALHRRYELGREPALINAVDEKTGLSSDALLLLTDAAGNTLAGNLDRVSADLWNSQRASAFAYRRTDNGRVFEREAFGFVARFPSGQRLIIARDIESQNEVRRVLLAGFVSGYGVILLIGVLGGLFVSGRILRRVDAASTTAHAIMLGNIGKRIPVSGRGDEFDRLSLNLNAMLDRIGDLMNGLKDVSDNIAHDLKTPLHRLRTRAERALQAHLSADQLKEALGGVIEEADGLIKTFDALLSIARLESGSRDQTFGELDICDLVRDVAELYEPAAEEKGLRLVSLCSGAIAVAGERHLLGQAVANLLDNAIKYASPRDINKPAAPNTNTIDVSVENAHGYVDVIVADRGPGVPVQDRERALQRFVRLQSSRSLPGSGLGLSLVSAVAHLHGGDITLEDNAPGLRVRLRIAKNTELLKEDPLPKALVHAD